MIYFYGRFGSLIYPFPSEQKIFLFIFLFYDGKRFHYDFVLKYTAAKAFSHFSHNGHYTNAERFPLERDIYIQISLSSVVNLKRLEIPIIWDITH